VLLKGHLEGEGAREPRLRARPVTERTRRYLANFNLTRKVPRWTCQIPRPPPGDGTFGANVGTPPPPYVGDVRQLRCAESSGELVVQIAQQLCTASRAMASVKRQLLYCCPFIPV
jgi:hypothetical protein